MLPVDARPKAKGERGYCRAWSGLEMRRKSVLCPRNCPQFFWPAALQQLTGFLADGTWVPMAAVQFAVVTRALLAAWMAARARE